MISEIKRRVDNLWDSKQIDGKINGRSKEQILLGAWQGDFGGEDAAKKINAEGKRLEELINRESLVEEKRILNVAYDEAVKVVNDFWNANADTNGNINGKNKSEILGETILHGQNTVEKLENERQDLIKKISDAKSEEVKQKGIEQKNRQKIAAKKILKFFRKEIKSNTTIAVKAIKDHWIAKTNSLEKEVNNQVLKKILGNDWEIKLKEKKVKKK